MLSVILIGCANDTTPVLGCDVESTLLLNAAAYENYDNKYVYDAFASYYSNSVDKDNDCFDALAITDDNYEVVLRSQSEKSNTDFVILYGDEFDEVVDTVAADHFSSKYIYIENSSDNPNVYSLDFDDYQLGYLAGVASAISAKSNNGDNFLYLASASDDLSGYRGYLAGISSHIGSANVILLQQSSTEAGLQSVESLIGEVYNTSEIYSTYAPAFHLDSYLVEKLKQVNDSYQSYLIGYGFDQYLSVLLADGESVYLTSVIKNYESAFATFFNKYLNNTIQGGSVHGYNFGILNDGISIELTENRNLSAQEISAITEIISAIKGGSLVVSDE